MNENTRTIVMIFAFIMAVLALSSCGKSSSTIEGQVGIQLESGKVVYMSKGEVGLTKVKPTYDYKDSKGILGGYMDIIGFYNAKSALANSKMLISVKTDFEGSYSFKDVMLGNYYICAVWKQGINQCLWIVPVTVAKGKSTKLDLSNDNLTEYLSD